MVADPDTRARTHLANERTFLSWFRTGLTLIAFGLAMAQFLTRDATPGFPIARTLSTIVIATGGLLAGVGIQRYTGNRARIDDTAFRPAGMSVVLASLAALVTAVLAVLFVWLIPDR